MPYNTHGLHHFHKRKRISRGEPYPHPNKWKRLMDKLIYIVIFVGPIMTIPQVITIWFERNASGVSVLSWMSYLFVSICWLIYSLLHREKPIIISAVIWIILEIMIVLGIVIYG